MTPPDLALRAARAQDAAALAVFTEHVFRDTFGPHYRAEDMDAYCSAAFSLAQQQRELADPDRHTVLALVGDELVGYLQLRTGAPPPCVTGPAPLELKRLYVARRWHGTGVAAALMTCALDIARQREVHTLYLSVWEHNHRAIAFYARHGFERVGTAPFQVGTDVQHDPIMVRRLLARPG